MQMDQIPPPGPPLSFHFRMSFVIALLTMSDLTLVTYSLDSVVLDGVSAMVLFAAEFMILIASIAGTSARYLIGTWDLRRARGRPDAPSWEEKSMYLFYVDLAVGTLPPSCCCKIPIETRLSQAPHLPLLLRCHPPELRSPTSHSPRRLHDISVLCFPMRRPHPLSPSHTGYGRFVPRCHVRGDGKTGRQNMYHLPRRDGAESAWTTAWGGTDGLGWTE